MCAELTKLWTIQLSFHPGPHPAHLEPFHQVTVKPRVDPSPSTRWSFLISVCTRLQQNTPLDRNGIMQRGDGVHSWSSLFKHLESNNCTTKECQIYLRTSHFTSFVMWWQPKQAGLCKRKHFGYTFHFYFSHVLLNGHWFCSKHRNYEGKLHNTLKVTAHGFKPDLTSLTPEH